MPALPDPYAGAAALLQALSAQGLHVQPLPHQPSDAPPARPILSATHLLLPESLDAEQRRAAVAHAAAHLLYSPTAQPSGTLKPMALAVISAIEDARVEQLLMQELPGVRAWFLAALQASVEPHGLSCMALLSRLSLALLDDDYRDGNHWVGKGRTLFAEARRMHSLHDTAAFRRVASVLSNDLGQMRVQFNSRQFAVPAPYRDDNSYLWDHGTSPDADGDPLAVQQPTKPGSPTADDAAPAAQLAELLYSYPEWDYRRRIERRDWCTVHEYTAAVPAPREPDGPTPRLPAPLAWRRLDRSLRLRRQREGEAIDLDAAVDAQVRHHLGQPSDGRLYLRAVPAPRRISMLVLLDLSLSTAERTQPDTSSLLELEQEAALRLASTARANGDHVAIDGFCSDTRARVHYHPLLGFDEPLDAQALQRVRAASARYSTRLGTALRHAARRLQAEHAELRALVVLTDGEPADIDVHDVRYLVEDARAAALAATQLGLQVWGVAVDPGAAVYARRIFGSRRQRVLPSPTQLPRLLGGLYARLAQG
jgi:Mg-chelatase subunit ChlD